MTMYFIILLCIVLSTTSATNFRQTRAKRRPDFEDKIKESSLLLASDTASVTACSLLCMGDIRCVSYFYVRTTRLCQLHSIVFYSQQLTTASPETSYYQLYEDWCLPGDQHNLYRQEDSCYKYYNLTYYLDYEQSIDLCLYYSATMLMVKTEEKYNHIKNYLLDEQHGTYAWDQFFIAARNDTGTLLWSDNTPVDFTDFASGEPSSNDEMCVTLHEIFSFKWNDVDCNYDCRVICEKFKPKDD
ncbi:hypothetical protein LOTGIDRAFT_174832 [Lottia gigantea]|uniref:C-type lectin domain-containing protein n=1 Tax=Lottia gigantea TaxID=225164 RepID=V4C4C1_LOTGI|nr:hypothetical protein LOTGIDRAFT_174832 [Lottia gigantea]ESO96379.1 hypothetical protein LOTGIDRAFT_174832 [Lottia gigantea]